MCIASLRSDVYVTVLARWLTSNRSHKAGTGGNATEGRDSAGGKAKAKKEFPEAPDQIGMQDERGGRGG